MNLNFYKEELDKKEIPEEIEKKIIEYDGNDLSEMISDKSDIEEILALSDIRKNILSWYEFKEGSTILELNADYGEITGLLCRKAKKVISIESSKKVATLIEHRHKNEKNLELVVGELSQIKLEEKFDYVVIIGISNGVEQVLEYANQNLKEDGTILLAVNNKFGVKSWVTTKEYENVVNNTAISATRTQLENLLQGKQYRFYYPLPNYKLPNIIYTENCIPTITNIYRNLTYKDGNVNFKEMEAYHEIIKDNPENFRNFANSFLIEISEKNLQENNIKFIAFSNMRKDEYRIETIVKEKEVYKFNINSKSEAHIKRIKENIEILNSIGIKLLDYYDQGKIISKYVEEQTLENKLITIYKIHGKDEFLKEIDKYKELLKEKLEVTNEIEENIFKKYKVKVENIEELTFVKHGFWDLIFQNCFIINNEYYFYDQEWYEPNIPIEYILYRAIIYFNESKAYISDEEVFEYLGIKKFIPVFKSLDDKIQEKIRKSIVWKLHIKDDLERNKYRRLKKELKERDLENVKLKEEIERLKIEHKNKCDEVIFMQNSMSWKITKPLRKLKGH